MKRFLVIFVASLLAFSGWAQKVEMFHADSAFEVPGICRQQLYERATSWIVDARKEYDTVYDYDSDPWGQSLEFVYRNVPAGNKYRNVDVRFRVTILPKEQGVRVILDRLFVNCYKGRRTVFCVEQIPMVPEGYFPDDRYLLDRLYISGFARDYANERFQELIPSIREAMEHYKTEFHLIQE